MVLALAHPPLVAVILVQAAAICVSMVKPNYVAAYELTTFERADLPWREREGSMARDATHTIYGYSHTLYCGHMALGHTIIQLYLYESDHSLVQYGSYYGQYMGQDSYMGHKKKYICD